MRLTQRSIVKIGAALALLGACAGGAAACGSAASESQSAGSAYRAAHPDSLLPSSLGIASTTSAEVQAALSKCVSGPIVLPASLPPGWGVAEPYIAVGSGSALPNPETWDGGYRATYTNGRAVVVVAINLDRPPGSGGWKQTDAKYFGLPMQARGSGAETVYRCRLSPSSRLHVVGLRVDRHSLSRVLGSLRPALRD